MIKHGQRQGGFTLIEVLVVLVILVMVTGVGVSTVSSMSGTRLRGDANNLAAAIRFAYNRSVVHGLYMRMEIDLDSNSYKVEASDAPIFISKKKIDMRDRDRQEEEAEKQAEKEAREAEREGRPVPKREQYIADGVIEPVTLEKGIKFAGVLTSAQEEIFENGKAYIHFFPNGYVEPSMIYMGDGEGTFTTLTVHPLTGKVTRKAGKIDPPREFGEPDRVEEEGR